MVRSQSSSGNSPESRLDADERLAVFRQHRGLLFAIAYRMLSSVSDAEDVLQEAWIRWQSTRSIVQSPKSFLSTLVTRLCIDQLRSARAKRENYVGVWLPEPLLPQARTAQSSGLLPTDHAELAESLSYAFLTLLECLSPTERAVFLLRKVFDYDYAEIADVVGKSVPNCRQIVRRAQQHITLRRPSVSASESQSDQQLGQFLHCWNTGDVEGLISLMAEDITLWSDGGGQVRAALKPLQGCQKVARFLIAIRRSPIIPPFQSELTQINHQPGLVTFGQNGLQSVFSFDWEDGKIQGIFAVVSPDKLSAAQRCAGDAAPNSDD